MPPGARSRRGWNADRPGATDICVAELICELLQLVGIKVIVVPEYMVVARPAGALDTLVRAKVKSNSVGCLMPISTVVPAGMLPDLPDCSFFSEQKSLV